MTSRPAKALFGWIAAAILAATGAGAATLDPPPPYPALDPLPWAVSAYIQGNDDVGHAPLQEFLRTVVLPNGKVFDVSTLRLEARALDSAAASPGSEGVQAAGWLDRHCFDDAGGAVGCNESTNGLWWWNAERTIEPVNVIRIAVYKGGNGYVAAVYADPATSSGISPYDGLHKPNPTTVIYNTGGDRLAVARYFASGDDMGLLHLRGQGLSHLSVYTAAEIPLPASLWLFAAGLAPLAAGRSRARRRRAGGRPPRERPEGLGDAPGG